MAAWHVEAIALASKGLFFAIVSPDSLNQLTKGVSGKKKWDSPHSEAAPFKLLIISFLLPQ